MKIRCVNTDYKVHHVKRGTSEHKRLCDGMLKIKEALLNDAKEDMERKSCLPSDWRSRILR